MRFHGLLKQNRNSSAVIMPEFLGINKRGATALPTFNDPDWEARYSLNTLLLNRACYC